MSLATRRVVLPGAGVLAAVACRGRAVSTVRPRQSGDDRISTLAASDRREAGISM
jgi:hypothetical protein